MENNNKAQELTDFIKFLIDTTNLYHVDNDLFVVTENDEKVILDKENNKPLKIFSIPLSNDGSLILNPINETIKDSIVNKFFYITLSYSIGMKIKTIIKYLIQLIPIQDDLSINMIKELSKYLELLDTNKSPKEIDTITQDYSDFVNIYYNKRLKKAYFRTGIFEDSFIGKFKNIRKKTWKFLDMLFCNIFDIDYHLSNEKKNIELREKYQHHSNDITCPKFISFINVYYKVLDRLNLMFDILELDDYIIDMSEFDHYLQHINQYYKLSKWASASSGTIDKKENKGVFEESPSLTNSSNIIPTSASSSNTSEPSSSVLTGGTLPGMATTMFPNIPITTTNQPYQQPIGMNQTGIIPTNPINNNIYQQQPSLFNQSSFHSTTNTSNITLPGGIVI